MSTVLTPDRPTIACPGTDPAPPSGQTAAIGTVDAGLWRLNTGSHVAISRDLRSRAAAVAVIGGSLEIDPKGELATLELTLADGHIHGVGVRCSAGVEAFDVWTITGTLVRDGRATPIRLALRDHGVVNRRGTWRWLSGTGIAPRCGRVQRHTAGSPLIADLLFRA